MKTNNTLKFVPFGGDEVKPIDFDKADIAVLPVCYEKSPSYGKGAEYGPFHILTASAQLEGIDDETFARWAFYKIHTLRPLFPGKNPEKAMRRIEKQAKKILGQKKFLLSLGGDHAISIGLVSAALNFFPKMGVLQIDAHLDFRDRWNQSPYNHACVMRRISEKGCLKIVPVGIRSFSNREILHVQKLGIRPFFAHETDPNDDSWIGEILCALPETVYLTLDLDGLDPSVIPATGTPEPGGLSYRQVVNLIKAVGKNKNVVAADINELAKIPGTRVSEFTAAKLATKIMIHCFMK